MKAVSISLKILAILAACFCVYAWLDTRGKVSSAEGLMKDVPGATLQEKSSNIPGILSEKAKVESSNKAFRASVSSLEGKLKSANDELESERVKNIKVNSELTNVKGQVSTLTANVASLKGQIAQKNTLIEQYTKELAEKNAMLANNNETDALKEKVATLEAQLKTKTDELAEANKKAKLMEMAEIVEVVETDASGKKIKRKIVKTPYVPTGDIATVIAVDQENGMVSINRGGKAGVKESQKILLKREGKLVSEILITAAKDDLAVGLINRDVAIPETIEVGDLLELAAPQQASESAPVQAPAPAAVVEELFSKTTRRKSFFAGWKPALAGTALLGAGIFMLLAGLHPDKAAFDASEVIAYMSENLDDEYLSFSNDLDLFEQEF